MSKNISKKIYPAFTLIELLIIIAIIGILASVILVSLNNTRDKARYSKAKAEMEQFSKAVQLARLSSGKTLMQITLNGCTGCHCRTDLFPSEGSSHPNCINPWNTALSRIGNAAGADFSALSNDPWGNPYLLDENELESGNCTVTDTRDSIRTMGPNGIYDSAFGSDDIGIRIPYYTCPGF